ncbi:TOMM precursor leader peptide-binding protein [Nocardia uniformis]|uniref:TOMM leader peptide-binding protein n=1 Tax=Nocardia uniformis TaxID=53432 RepID=A0A849C9H1_9NOCA|nr:TOMM precursor leader peptide-binding protein [Nocardia uniformis]NNH69601.1 TOMM precursor leader peptide-binding protein [Nocardia uniformis]
MSTRVHNPMLHPRVAVLVRRSGAVQLGWDPGQALQLHPAGMDAATVLAFLRLLDGLRTRAQILWRAREFGVDSTTALSLLAEIGAAGLLSAHPTSAARVRCAHVYGRGPLSDALLRELRRIGVRPSHSRAHQVPFNGRHPDLVVLADVLVPAPDLVEELVRRHIPHLQVRIRDGRGVIGPLVLPGITSCLHCADLHRIEHDPDWPHLAAQLLGRVGQASPAGIAATVGLALAEIEAVAAGSTDHPPVTFDATLELNLDSRQLDRRVWPPHPACVCRESPAHARV